MPRGDEEGESAHLVGDDNGRVALGAAAEPRVRLNGGQPLAEVG